MRTSSQSKTLKKNPSDDRAAQLFTKIEQLTKDFKPVRKSINAASLPLIQIKKDLKSLSNSLDYPKFTRSPTYKSGKFQLFKNSSKFDEQNAIVDLLNIIDNKNPGKKKFLTPEVMRSKLTKKIFQTRKRGFGSKSQNQIANELEGTRTYAGLDSKQSLMLKKVLYKYNDANSPASSMLGVDLKNEPSVESLEKPETKVISLTVSPVFSKKVYFRKDFDDMNINKDYREVLKKSEIETGIHRVRLSKILTLKSVFKLNL